MVAQATQDLVDSFWADRFGCSLQQFRSRGVRVVAHAADLRDYGGLYAFRRDGTCIVSLPEARVSTARSALAERAVDDVFEAAALRGVLGDAAGIVVGPAAIAYADASTFRAAVSSAVRLLVPDDAPLLRALATACDETEWDHSSIEFDREPIFGCFIDHVLVAAASYRKVAAEIASIGIITHPAYRGCGFGRAAGSAATAHALDAGHVTQWQTPESNIPSLAISRAIGYEPYCRTIAVRLRAEH